MLFNISYIQSLCDKYGFVLNTNGYKVAPYIYELLSLFMADVNLTHRQMLLEKKLSSIAKDFK